MENQEIDKKLESKNIKPTAMRELVYEVLNKSQKALNLKEIEEQFENVDRSTIFRSLKTFQDNFLVHIVDDGSGTVKYALCDDDCTCSVNDSHVHFMCNRCGRTRCMKDIPIPKINLPEGFTFESASIVVKGVCPVCD
jgi:Fur family ferric uptake transcriptional regulator